MNQQSSFSIKNKIKNLSILDCIKIIIFVLISITLTANFLPYYEGWDSYVFGVSGISFSEGTYEITNKLFQDTGSREFIPHHMVTTVQNNFIPIASPGILVISALSYIIGGYYGLFYIGPIIAILFLIISERIATKLFGTYVGLFTLVLLGTDFLFLGISAQLLSDNIFSIFLILGCFYLINFFHKKNSNYLFLGSSFFVISAFFRFNGLIFFPVEILVVIGYFVYEKISVKSSSINSDKNFVTTLSTHKFRTKFIKISGLILIPWLLFFMFWFSFNEYYFGDPTKNFYSGWTDIPSILSIFTIDTERLEFIKEYSVELLPDTINSYLPNLSSLNNNPEIKNILGFFSFIILISALFISLYKKQKRTEVIIFIVFIVSFLAFYSSAYATSIGIDARFMIPVLSLYFILFGFIIHMIWKESLRKILINRSRTNLKVVKGILLVILISVSLVTLSDSLKIFSEKESIHETKEVQLTKTSGFIFKNPENYVKRFPIDKEGLSQDSIIMAGEGRRIVELELTPLTISVGGIFPLETSNLTDTTLETDSELTSIGPIMTLKTLLKDGYNVYSFKEHRWEVDPHYFRYIETNHGIILKEFSKSFCKIEQIGNSNESIETVISKSDDACFVYNGKVIPKY